MSAYLIFFCLFFLFFFFFNHTTTTDIYTLSLHDALPISSDSIGNVSFAFGASRRNVTMRLARGATPNFLYGRSEEHTSELQSLRHLVCRLLLEKKKKKIVLE